MLSSILSSIKESGFVNETSNIQDSFSVPSKTTEKVAIFMAGVGIGFFIIPFWHCYPILFRSLPDTPPISPAEEESSLAGKATLLVGIYFLTCAIEEAIAKYYNRRSNS